MNLRIYCINLKSRADRWERFFQQPGFQELIQKYPWERFDAIDGKTIDIEKDTRVSLRTRRNIMYKKRRDHEDLDSAGGVGCYLSHYTVWTKIIAQPEEYGLVFEDDALIPLGFVQQLETAFLEYQALEEKAKPDVWTLSVPFNRTMMDAVNNTVAFNFGDWNYSVNAPNTANIYTKKAVKILVDNAFPIDGHVDFFMFRCAQLGLIVYAQYQKLWVRQVSLKKKGIVDSNIQGVKCDVCNIPSDANSRGYFILSGQNKVSIMVVLIGFGILYAMKRVV